MTRFLLFILFLATSLSGQQCDPSLFAHTYKPARFTIIAKCKAFTGVIEFIRHEPDGDDHIRLKLDPGQGKPLNHSNMTRQHGTLVVEPVCVHSVSQKDAIAACKGARKVLVPKVGAHVRVRGVYALDKPHGWIEVHGAEIEVIP